MHSQHALRAARRLGDQRDWNRRSVTGKNGGRIDRRLRLAKNLVLDGKILEHCFDHQVDVTEPRVVDGTADQRHVIAILYFADLLFVESLFQDVAHGGIPLRHPRVIGVFEAHEASVLHCNGSDACSHESGADDRDLLHGERIECRDRQLRIL